MAQIQLAVNGATSAGVNPVRQTGVEAAGTDQYFFPADPNILLRIENGAAAVDVTFITAETRDGLAMADRTVSIPLNATRYFRFPNTAVYADANGQIQMTFNAARANTVLEVVRV